MDASGKNSDCYFNFEDKRYYLNQIHGKIGTNGIRKLYYNENNASKTIEGLGLNHLVKQLDEIIKKTDTSEDINVDIVKNFYSQIKRIEINTSNVENTSFLQKIKCGVSSFLHRIRSGASSLFYDRETLLSNIDSSIKKLEKNKKSLDICIKTQIEIKEPKIPACVNKEIDLIGGLPSELQNLILRNSSISGIIGLRQASRNWNETTCDESLWKELARNLGIQQTLNQESVKDYVLKIKKQTRNSFIDIKGSLEIELDKLLKSETIGDLNYLVQICKARDTLIVWRELQKQIGGNLDLDIAKFNSTDHLIELAEKFQSWCVKHREDLKNVNELNLSENQLTSLPDGFEELANLNTLYLSRNQLTSLPDKMGKLANLRTLCLSDNQLTSLPNGLGELTNLKHLDLSYNQLTSLPNGFEQLENLMYLDLLRNKLTSLPNGFEQLKNLSYLNLTNNRLTSLPEGFGQLPNLVHLNLRRNPLTSLPNGFEQLKMHLNYLTM